MPHNKEGIGRLTNGETLLIIRHRRAESQRDAARRHKVPLSTYSQWERDLEAGPRENYGKIEVHEKCLLARRRCGKTQNQIAKDMGICRYWLNKMEQGLEDCTALACYWES